LVHNLLFSLLWISVEIVRRLALAAQHVKSLVSGQTSTKAWKQKSGQTTHVPNRREDKKMDNTILLVVTAPYKSVISANHSLSF
jgi:hypothetical protein